MDVKNFFVFVVMGILLCLQLPSCGKDDPEDEPVVTPVDNPVERPCVAPSSDLNGMKLVEVDGMTLSYTSDGILRTIQNNYDGSTHYSFDFENGIMKYENEKVCTFKTNQHGYITKAEFRGAIENSWYDTFYAVWEMSYNDAGHLVTAVYTMNHEVDANKVVMNFIWNGDLLTEVNGNGEYCSDHAELEKWDFRTELSYENAKDNTSMQYTYNMVEMIDPDGDIEDLMFTTRLFGKGPSKYPTKISNWGGTDNFEYILNDKGLVIEELNDGYVSATYKYSE